MKISVFVLLAGIFTHTSALGAASAQTTSGGNTISKDEMELSIFDGEQLTETKVMQEKAARALAQERRKKGQQVKLKRLPRPKLRFIDKSGKATREIVLGTEVAEVLGSFEGSSEVLKRKKVSVRRADLSSDKTHAVIWEINTEPFDPGDARQTGSIAMVNSAGNTIWEKKLPRFKVAGSCKTSDAGRKTATIQSWTKAYQLPASEPVYQLVVYDEQGNDLIRFPNSQAEGYERLHSGIDDLVLSPNGRYIAVRAEKGKKEIVLFFDLIKKSHWDMPVAGLPIDISDSGLARVSRLSGTEVEVLNLKDKL